MNQNSHSAPFSEHSLFTNAPIGIITTTPDGRILSANPAMAKMFGYDSPDELFESAKGNITITQFYADPTDIKELMRLLRENEEVLNYECKGIHRDGSMIWISINISAVRDSNGQIIHFQSFITDISQRKQVEVELRESENKFRNIFNNSSDAVFIHDLSGRCLEVNDVACERLGYTRQELLGLTPMDIDVSEAPRMVPERMRNLEYQDIISFEGTHVRKDGVQFPVEITSRLIEYEGVSCILSTARDIGERRAAEAKRDEYQRILSSAFRAMDSLFMVIDRDYRILLCNWKDHQWVPEDERERSPHCYQVKKDLQTPCPHCPPAQTFRDGQVRRFEDQNPIDNSLKEIDVLPILDEKGSVEYVLENVRDVTERKEEERELQRSHYLLDKSQEIAHLGSWELDVASGGFTWSDEAYRIVGLEPQECQIDFETFQQFVHPEDREVIHSAYWELVRNNRDTYEIEYRIHPRGAKEVRTVFVKCFNLRDESGSIARILGMVQDITERKRYEEKIRHFNRVLAAIRDVNKLITAEMDRDRLIGKACQKFVEMGGYDFVWIALFDDTGACCSWHEAGLDEHFLSLKEELQRGELPPCAREALDCSDVVVVRDPGSHCSSCLLSGARLGSARIAVPLAHQGTDYGVMFLSLPLSYADDEEEWELVREVARDISFALNDIEMEEERVRAQAALNDSERFLSFTLDGLAAHISVLDQNGEIVLVNRAWREFAAANGIAAGHISEGINYITVCSEATGEYAEGAQDFARGIRDVISGERESFSQEYPCHSPNLERWFTGRVTPFFETPPRRVVISHWEITERKQAERALRESERKYRDLFNNSPVGINLIDSRDSQGMPYYVNPEMARMLGASSPEELLRRFRDFSTDLFVQPERRSELRRILRERGEVESFEFEARRLDGERIWMHIYARIREWLNEEDFLVDGFAVDVTERKRAEEAFRRLSEEQGLLLESVPTQIWYLTEPDHYGTVNQAHADFYGLDRKEMEYRLLWDFLSQEEARIHRDGNLQVFETGEQIRSEERLRNASGEMRLIEVIKTPKLGASGEVEYVVCAGSDITEHKQAQQELQFAYDKLDTLVELNTDGIMVVDRQGVILFLNPAVAKMLGRNKSELLGEQFGYPLSLDQSTEIELLTENGDIRVVELSTGETEWDGQSALFTGFRDITERKQAEENLQYLSFHDSLTGLYNRNFFNEEMNRLQDGRSSPVGILICDLDGLKVINDSLGHSSGDELLANTAEILRNRFRFSDILARIGGDEFAILIPDTNAEVAEKLAQRLRSGVEEYNSQNPRLPISLSVGYAVSEQVPINMQELFREADNRMYREKVQRKESGHNAAVQALSQALEARDFITEGHSERLQNLVVSLARTTDMLEDEINDLLLLAQFHDLGKLGIPDRILFKPGPLSEEEWQEMRQHSEIGHRIAQSVPDLAPITEWIYKHHERWDGGGYPLGLKGEEIPLPCRILAIADSYDAMISDRPYRSGMSQHKAVQELRRCAGTQFDPNLVEQFIQILDQYGSE